MSQEGSDSTFATTGPAPEVPDVPVELGAVAWGRDFELALTKAGETEKPLLLLFQEVPG